MKQPFWEDSYRNDDISTFGIEPNATVKEMQPLYSRDWHILDVGCGEGKNDIYLAKEGFENIDAIDISKAGIEKLQRLAKLHGVKINASVQDLRDFEFTNTYDLIMTHGTLHFVTKEEWHKFLIEAKQKTNPKGIHIIQIFNNKLPATPDIAPFIKDLADEGELEYIYRDWEILQSKNYTFKDEHPGVPVHVHASSKIVARKP